MKKTLGILLMVLMLVLSGCSTGSKPNGDSSGGKPADDYPSKPIHFIMQFNPGGGGDQMFQELKPKFEEKLGNSMVIDYKPGANTQIGYELINASQPDGYTIGFLTTPHLQLSLLTQEPKYKLDDFVPVGTHHMDATLFYTKKDGKYKTMQDVIKDAKERPGQVILGVAGLSSDMGVAIKSLEEAAGIKFSIVPTSGGAQVLSGVLGGHFDIGVHRPTSALGAKDELTGLAILTEKRDINWTETPTFKEALPELNLPVVGTWRGVVATKAFKEKYPERYEKLVQAFKEIVNDKEYQDTVIKKYGWQIDYHTPEETLKIMQDDMVLMEKYADLLSE